MPIISDLPLQKGAPAVKFGDTGKAVEQIQIFLQSTTKVQEHETYLADFGKGFSLLDGNHFGSFEKDTHYFVLQYQQINYKRIIKFGLTAQEFEAEKGMVGWATWQVMLEDQKKATPGVPEVPAITPVVSTTPEPKIPDPPLAGTVPEATHFVMTRNSKHRLALRKAPSYVEVSKEAAEDTELKGDLVSMMPNWTLVEVIEYGIGYKCLWSQVKVWDTDPIFDSVKELQKTQKLFCFSEFIQPLSKTKQFLPVRCMDCGDVVSIKTSALLDWHELDICEPFIDSCFYYIAVTTKYETSDDGSLSKQRTEAIEIGIDRLLDYYDKSRISGDIEKYIDVVKAPEWYLDERPGSQLKFLVQFPAKYFDAIPQNPDVFKNIPIEETSNQPEGWKTANLESRSLRNNLKRISQLLREYAPEVNVDLGVFDFETEATRLEQFVPVFEAFLNDNGYQLDNDKDTYEFGFRGKCFELYYILVGVENVSSPLRIGLDCFLRKEPVVFENTMSLVFYSQDIVEQLQRSRLVYTDFINSYFCPIPEIRPGQKKEKHVEPPRLVDKSEKTETEKKGEDEILSDPPTKERLADARELVFEYIGDTFLACDNLIPLLGRLTTLDELYSQVLNKVDVRNIAGFVVSCLMSRFFPYDLRLLVCKLILKELRLDQLQKLLGFLDSEVLSKVQKGLADLPPSELNVAASSDTAKIRNVLQTAASEEDLCRAIASFDPRLFIDKFNLLLSLQIPKLFDLQIPTIQLPEFNIEDLLAQIAEALIEVIKQLLTSILMELVKSILGSLCDQCKPPDSSGQRPENYGDQNINDIVNPRSVPAMFDSGLFPKDPALETSLRNLLDDLSNILLPSEICALLHGEASAKVLLLVKRLIVVKYPELSQYLGSLTQIQKLFVYFGGFLKPSICDDFVNLDQSFPTQAICPENTNFRDGLLKQKLSSKQIEEQLAKTKEKNSEKLEKLLDYLGAPDLIEKTLKDNGFSDLKCFLQSKLQQMQPPVVENAQDRMLDTIFDSISMTFNNDLAGFFEILRGTRKEGVLLNFNRAETIAALNASRKLLDTEFKEADKEALLKNPDGTGLLSKTVTGGAIAPVVRKVLSDSQSITRTEDGFLMFAGPTSMIAISKLMEEIKKSSLTKEEKKAMATVNPAVIVEEKQTVHARAPSAISQVSSEVICEEELPSEVLSWLMTARFEDVTEVQANSNVEGLTVIRDKREADQNILKEYNLSYTNLEDMFAQRMKNIFSTSVDKASLAKLDGLSMVWKTMFFDILTKLIRFVSEVSAGSGLYNVANFNKLQIIEDLETNFSKCASEKPAFDSLLGLGDAKESAKSEFRKQQSGRGCSDSVTTVGEVTSNKTLEMLIRVIVLENVLELLFLLDQIDLQEVDNILSGFILTRVKRDLQQTDFYDQLLSAAKRSTSGKNLVVNKDDPGEKEKKSLANELHPDNISGEAQLNYVIQEQIRSIVGRLKEILSGSSKPIFDYVFAAMEFTDLGLKVRSFVNVIQENGVKLVTPKRLMVDEFRNETPELCGEFGITVYLDVSLSSLWVNDLAAAGINWDPANTLIPLVEAVVDDEVISNKKEFSETGLLEKAKGVFANSDDYKLWFGELFQLSRIVSVVSVYNIMVFLEGVEGLRGSFNNTKLLLRSMYWGMNQGDDWYKNKNPERLSNADLYKAQMANLTTDGPTGFNLAALAAKTVPILLKGVASTVDPNYVLIKQLWNLGATDLDFSAVFKTLPCTIFPFPVGIGPPLTALGILALAMDLLSGERKQEEGRKNKGKTEEECD